MHRRCLKNLSRAHCPYGNTDGKERRKKRKKKEFRKLIKMKSKCKFFDREFSSDANDTERLIYSALQRKMKDGIGDFGEDSYCCLLNEN